MAFMRRHEAVQFESHLISENEAYMQIEENGKFWRKIDQQRKKERN